VIIRKAIKEDAPKLDEMLTSLIQDERQYDDNINERFKVEKMYENYIEDETRYILVAENENHILGYIYGYCENTPVTKKPTARIDALYVREEARNNGIARKLISSFINWAKIKNITSIEIGVLNANNKAMLLYTSLGFNLKKSILEIEL